MATSSPAPAPSSGGREEEPARLRGELGSFLCAAPAAPRSWIGQGARRARGGCRAAVRVAAERNPGKDSGAMGQLCCFPFTREEGKIYELERSSSVVLQRYSKDTPTWSSGNKTGAEPDDVELVRLSKRLVENAVLKAVQQYLEETQNKKQPGEGSSVKAEEADGSGNGSDNNRK
ncbi:A-kinase anchor protein 7 isoform X2 [Heterocephalus glaber]|uniref:A-kinase anchor protein 7 isoform X2 n=2 Tax=Heterocephalus glaber TaxID=10181 RepID=A0AAX6P926_HETGA|nr:A-kinase anchor protein 7 isoform X2 [Heterocephalus glaber]